jgi:Zn-dependent peptidase ImmA (M78 family)
MDGRRYKAIEQKAFELLKRHDMLQPNFDVVSLIDRLGIRCVQTELPSNISGASMIEDGTRVVTINAHHHENRRRFTAAHELGHIALGHDTSLNISEGSAKDGQDDGSSASHVVLFRDDRSSLGADWREIEANHFAASLLMPKELLENEIAKLDGHFLTEEHVQALAEMFGVSPMAMSIRLSKLGYI